MTISLTISTEGRDGYQAAVFQLQDCIIKLNMFTLKHEEPKVQLMYFLQSKPPTGTGKRHTPLTHSKYCHRLAQVITASCKTMSISQKMCLVAEGNLQEFKHLEGHLWVQTLLSPAKINRIYTTTFLL
jgi:hypothetical protein